VMNHWSYSCLF